MLNSTRVVVVGAALVAACGGAEGRTPSSGGAAGVGGAAGAATAGATATAGSGSGGLSSAGGKAGNAGSGGVGGVEVELPAGALEIGPYGFTGNRSSTGTSWSYSTSLGPGGRAVFGVTGNMMLGEAMPVVTGLLRAPSSALGSDWHCPGAATWVPTSTNDTSDCGRSRCEYVMIMPTPTRLACGAPGGKSLTFAPAIPGEMAQVTSSLAEYDGLTMVLASAAGLGLDPQQVASPTSLQFFSGEGPQLMITDMFFEATPVPAAPGAPVTEWTLSSPFVLRKTGFAGETTLYCATSGTYRISGAEPIRHSVELTGLSDELHCPGAPLAQPVVLHLD